MAVRIDMSALPQLLTGETVTVLTPSTTYDANMDETTTWTQQTVDNVVVAPGSTSDVVDSTRPHGTRAALTLAFPRGFSSSLRGCRVQVRGAVYDVIGDPQPNTSANCPTQWWYTAEVEAVDG